MGVRCLLGSDKNIVRNEGLDVRKATKLMYAINMEIFLMQM